MSKDKDNETIQEIAERTARSSTDFETTNTDLKRKFLIWNIESFNIIASTISTSKGSFGTGYPFYALDSNLEGELPVIQEQVRYNRQLVVEGKRVAPSIWECKSCLERNYAEMPDLKIVCKPCPNMFDQFKPRKIINRLPDMDMWVVCEDGYDNVIATARELEYLLKETGMRTSDVEPLRSLDEVVEIADDLKKDKFPRRFLPIDAHIIEYSKIKALIERVPDELREASEMDKKPYLPIQPLSLRKDWQYDDEAYNFIYDYLSAFKSFNFTPELQEALDKSRIRVVNEHSADELFNMLIASATEANARRFETPELEGYFRKKVEFWKNLSEQNKGENIPGISYDDGDER